MCRFVNFLLSLWGRKKTKILFFITCYFSLVPQGPNIFLPQREGPFRWLETQKAMGLGILNPLAIKVKIEFQQSDGQSPGSWPYLTDFQLGVVSSVWLLNNTFQYIDVSTINFLFSFLLKQWPQSVASNAQKVASISRDWKLEVSRVEWGRDLERNCAK